MFIFNIFISIAYANIPNYRTTYHEKIPDGFNKNKYASDFEINLGKKEFHCFIANNQNPKTSSTPEEYLRSFLFGHCFEITHTKYWFFKYCPFKVLTQYRYDDDNVKHADDFVLGRDTGNPYEMIERGFAANWTAGDICAISKKPRTARVELICDMSISEEDIGIVTSISEPKYCDYLVRFHTPHACAFPGITNESLSKIDCILKTEYDIYNNRK